MKPLTTVPAVAGLPNCSSESAVGESEAKADSDSERHCRPIPSQGQDGNHDRRQAKSSEQATEDAAVCSDASKLSVREGCGMPTGSGTRPPRPPGSIRQGRREKRKAGWAAKKLLAKQKKAEERERR